jgi:hypothetical protein
MVAKTDSEGDKVKSFIEYLLEFVTIYISMEGSLPRIKTLLS